MPLYFLPRIKSLCVKFIVTLSRTGDGGEQNKAANLSRLENVIISPSSTHGDKSEIPPMICCFPAVVYVHTYAYILYAVFARGLNAVSTPAGRRRFVFFPCHSATFPKRIKFPGSKKKCSWNPRRGQ